MSIASRFKLILLPCLAILTDVRGEPLDLKHRVLQEHRGSVMSLAFVRDAQQLASSSRDGTIKLWDLERGALLRSLAEHTDDVFCITFSRDGRRMASGSSDTTIRLWDTATFDVLRVLPGHKHAVRWVRFSTDGATLASVGGDHAVRLWDVASGKQIRSITGHHGIVKMVHFTHDGKSLITCGTDATIRVWDAHTGQQRLLLTGHTNSVESIALSADGRLLASSSNDGSIRIWDVQTGQPIHLLLGHVGEVDSVTFPPSNRIVISGSKDKTIRIWDLSDGKLLHSLTGHTGRVESMEISADGRTLATGGGGGDTSVRLWDLSSLADVLSGTSEAPIHPTLTQADAPGTDLRQAEVDQLWRLLGNDDGDDVGVAMQRLIELGDPALPQLAKRVTPLDGPVKADTIERLITELDSPDPAVRERITCDLIQAGEAIEAPVRQALTRPVSPIVRHRLEMALRDVMTKEAGATQSAASLTRKTSCAQALERIGTPAAKKLLTSLLTEASKQD